MPGLLQIRRASQKVRTSTDLRLFLICNRLLKFNDAWPCSITYFPFIFFLAIILRSNQIFGKQAKPLPSWCAKINGRGNGDGSPACTVCLQHHSRNKILYYYDYCVGLRVCTALKRRERGATRWLYWLLLR